MLNELFSSKARVKILRLFLLNPKNKYYQREIALKTVLPIRAVQREMEKLGKIGIFSKEEDGNRHYYSINASCPVIPELKALFLKTAGLGEYLKEYFSKGKNGIRVAFIYGSYAKDRENASSDIDVFVIGGISARELSGITSKIGREFGREINYVLYTEKEFQKKQKDHFIRNVLKEPKIFITGGLSDLRAVG